MPPSHHSSSSHSSHSHSSSRSSSHSSSSHSSSSRSSSSSSYSSRSVSHKTAYRARVNQPKGYQPSYSGSQLVRHCRHHDYVYYGADWTYEGTYYKKGFYDENGTWYRRVAFRENGKYSLYMTCEYCGNGAVIEWKEGDIPHCSNCGAAMNLSDIMLDDVEPVIVSGSGNNITPKTVYALVAMIFAVTLAFIGAVFAFINHQVNSSQRMVQEITGTSGTDYDRPVLSNVDIYGDELYLKQTAPQTYVIVEEEGEADKVLTWDWGADSYYDTGSDCYLWYNTDVAPNLWQYWYEGVSYIYQDYGWMEYEDGVWWIEKAENNWIEYTGDTSELWHIEK